MVLIIPVSPSLRRPSPERLFRLPAFLSPSLSSSVLLFLTCAQLSSSSFGVYLFIQSSCTVCMHKFSPGGARAAQRSVAANHTGSGEGGGGRREEVVEKEKERGEEEGEGGRRRLEVLVQRFLRGRLKGCWFVSPITHRNNSKILFHRSLINRPSARRNFPTSLLWHSAPSSLVLTENFTFKN